MTNRVLVSINHKTENEGYPNVIVANQEDLIEHLKEALKQGPIKFTFLKSDGSIREAYGTTFVGLIPKKIVEKDRNSLNEITQDKRYLQDILENIKANALYDAETMIMSVIEELEQVEEKLVDSRQSERKTNDALIVYFDLQKLEFRSMKKDSLVTVYL